MQFLSIFSLVFVLMVSPIHALSVGGTIPSISLPELSSKAPTSLESFRGNVVLIDFWGSWCIPCKASFPQYEKFHREYGSQGFTVVGVNEDESVASAQEFLATYPVTFTILHDVGKAAAKTFNPAQMPTAFLVDREGKIAKIYEGFRESEVSQMKSDIERLLDR